MRRTYSYSVGGVAAALLGIFVYAKTDSNIILAFVAGVVGFAVAFFVVRAIENALHNTVNNVVYSGSRNLAGEILNTNISFNTTIDKEEIIFEFLSRFPSETSAMALKIKWICGRTDDSVLLGCGITSLKYLEINAPMAIAQIKVKNIDNSRTVAAFSFPKYNDDGTAPYAKEMALLVGTVKDIFLELDPDCKITEN